MTFKNPEFLFLFVLLFLGFLWNTRWALKARSRFVVPLGHWIDSRPKTFSITPFRFSNLVRFVALSFLIIALARPQKVLTKVKKNVDAVDIIITFDLSKSMDAIDFKPDRRTVAIQTLSSFIDRRPDDRIGLVLFSGEAYMAVPLTLDHDVLKKSINESSNRLLQDGTAIGQSIAVAVHHLRNSKAKSRVIIVVTDGDNNMGSVDPITAAELAKGYGLKIYTIGIGKKGKVKFPVTRVDPLTGAEFTEYQDLIDAVNDELLDDIAQRTQGQFFRAGDENVLDQIFKKIDSLEKTEVEYQTLTKFTELAWPFILIAFLCLIAEGVGLNSRWRKFP
jgi:Ca-activated chloride channel family protein